MHTESKMAVLLYNNRRQRVFRHHLNPLEYYDEVDLITKYRFNANGIGYINGLVGDTLRRSTLRNNALDTLQVVCAGLRFLTTGSFQMVIM